MTSGVAHETVSDRPVRRRRAIIVSSGLVVVLGFVSWGYGRWPAVSMHGNAMCSPDSGVPFLVEAGSIVNDRAIPLHVSSLALHEPDGLHLDSVWMLKSGAAYAVPEYAGPDLEAIADPMPASGVDVPAGESVRLIASVSADLRQAPATASAEGFDVVYRVGPWTHDARSGIDVTVVHTDEQCVEPLFE